MMEMLFALPEQKSWTLRTVPNIQGSENQKTFHYLWGFYLLLFRGFFVAFPWLFRGPLPSRKTVFGPFSWFFRGFFVVFSWLFRGPRFGQNLRVLALEQSSEKNSVERIL